MTIDQERKYVLSQFEKTITVYKNRRVAIYGTGENTKYIIEHSELASRCVVALMNGDDCAMDQFGMPVITCEMAKSMVDVIVVVAQFASLSVIYRKIKELEQHGISIVDLAKRPLSSMFFVKSNREICDVYELGYDIYGPLLVQYVNSLIEYTRADFDKILFFARDGYVVEKIYNKLIEAYDVKNAAKGLYVHASRRALAVASIRDRRDILAQLDRIPTQTTAGEILRVRFGVFPKSDDMRQNDVLIGTELKDYLSTYEQEILAEACDERNCYLEYLRSIGVADSDKNIIFDSCTTGTSGYFYRKLTNSRTGVYAIQLLDLTNFSLFEPVLDQSFFEVDTNFLKKSAFNRMGTFNDVVLSSTATQLIRIDQNMRPVFSHRETDRKLQYMNRIHEAILEYCYDYVERYKRTGHKDVISKATLDKKLAVLADGYLTLNRDLARELYTVEEFSGMSGKICWRY